MTGSLASLLDDTALGDARHRGPVPGSGAERVREGLERGAEPELDNLVRHIEADQSIEIDRMRQLLGGR
jgi:hypothetical protein